METKVGFCKIKERNNDGPPSVVMRDWGEAYTMVENVLMFLSISVIANFISTSFEISSK